MHAHKLHYDVQTGQITGLEPNHRQVFLALFSSVLNIKYKGRLDSQSIYIADIMAPKLPLPSGMLAIICIDKNIL
jgi:hypothetical protein